MPAPYACRSARLAQPPGSRSANDHTLQTHSVTMIYKTTITIRGLSTATTEHQPRYSPHNINTRPHIYHSDSDERNHPSNTITHHATTPSSPRPPPPHILPRAPPGPPPNRPNRRAGHNQHPQRSSQARRNRTGLQWQPLPHIPRRRHPCPARRSQNPRSQPRRLPPRACCAALHSSRLGGRD